MFAYLVSWSLNNRLLVLACMLGLVLFGFYKLDHIAVDVFPEFAPPQVVVQTQAPGLAPQDVEALITYPLESAINGTPGVTRVRSKTGVGLSTITIIFSEGSNIYQDRQLITERIQQVLPQLPAGSNPEMLPVISVVGWLVKYALVSNTLSAEDLRTISEWVIRPRILALGGIASVVSLGGEVKQYQVLLDPTRLLAYRISVEEVRQALENSNRNVPGAFLEKSGTELAIGAIGRVKTLEDIRKTIITTRKGIPITIENVAKVTIGGEIKRGDAAFNLEEAVIGTISKTFGADTLTTTYRVQKTLADIKASLPPGVELHTSVFRQANFIEAAIKNLSFALLEGALIVFIVLMVFLMNSKASFITFLAMPVSFIIAILVLDFFGLGINAMTLGGLAIAIGEVVDDGIITVENVLRRVRLNRISSAPKSLNSIILASVIEIRASVIYATLITTMVFLPIFFLSGIAERIFSPLALAYIAAVLGSLLVSITLVPALCSLFLTQGKHKKQEEQSPFARWLKQQFQPLLNWSLTHKKSVLGFASLSFLFAIGLIPWLHSSFLPEFHEGNFIIAMSTLPGTSLDESMRIGKQVRKKLLQYPQVISITQRAGRSALDEDALSPNISEFDVDLNFAKDSNTSPAKLIKQIRQDLALIPGAVFNVGQFIAHRMDEVLSGVRSQVAIKIFGDNLSTLNQLTQTVEQTIKPIPGIVDIYKEQPVYVPQLMIKIDRDKATRYGINVGRISEDVQVLLNGLQVSKILEGQRSFDLYLRLAESGRDSVRAVQDMLIDAHGEGIDNGDKIPLRAVAHIEEEEQPFSISRENVQRMTTVGFNIQGRDLSRVIQEVEQNLKSKIKLPDGYFIEYGGQFESQQQARHTILWLGLMVVLIMFLLLFRAFGNCRWALLVLCNLPLAFIGGIISLFLFGGELSVAALIGFITLFGIAARNGIILISHYTQLQKESKTLQEVIFQGTLDRLVPVLMTAATTSLGLIPLLWGSPIGKELERPLAQVVLGGLVTSTFLNLIMIPTLYYALEQRRNSNG